MKNIIPEIEFQVGQIRKLFTSYEETLQRCRKTAPGFIEIVALASFLHSFYNGIESVFLLAAKNIDGGTPDSRKWHRDLLLRMAEETAVRGAVISIETRDKLIDYLAFRHFYRHSYSHIMEWAELEKLIMPVTDVWNQIEKELLEFISYLRSTHTK